MKVSNINIFNFAPAFSAARAKTTPLTQPGYNSIQFDTVTFGGKIEKSSEKDRVKLGVEFGKELYEASKKEALPMSQMKIQKMARRYNPIFSVDSPDNLGQKSGFSRESLRATAATMPKRNKDGSLKQVIFFIDKIGKEGTNKQIAIITHEFTHGLQELDGNIFNIAFEAAGKDVDKAETLMHFACRIFHAIETEIADTFAQNAEHLQNRNDLTKEDIYDAFNCKDKAEFKKIVRRIFNNDINIAIDGCRQYSMWDKIALKDNPIALRRFVKQDCIEQAKMEAEAYRAQKEIFEYMGEPVRKIGAAAVIYEALSEAFE